MTHEERREKLEVLLAHMRIIGKDRAGISTVVREAIKGVDLEVNLAVLQRHAYAYPCTVPPHMIEDL